MSQLVAQLVTAAVVGAISPVATMATIAVLSGRHRPLPNAVSLLCGWTFLMMAIAALVRVLIGDTGPAVTDSTKAVLNLAIGLLLLSFGLRNLLGAEHPLAKAAAGDEHPGAALPHWMRTLDTLTVAKSFAVGFVLLAVSPADLAVYLSALQGLGDADISTGMRLVYVALLIVAVDLCILVPLAIYVLVPARSAELLAEGRRWLVSNQRKLMTWVCLVFGVLLIATSATKLA